MRSIMEKVEFLRNTPLFASTPEKSIASIADLARTRRFKDGEVIISEDSQSTMGFYVILEGTAKAVRGEHHLADFAPGDYFGEIALLLDDTPRTATVAATSDIAVLVVSRWDFKALLKTNPEIAVGVMGVLAKRLASTDRVLHD
jgi:CRP-like cAMP-binding protein